MRYDVVAHNLLAMGAQRQFNIVTDSKKKTTEALSSGYRINRAGDDAAGLAISEKMRAQIRGLHQGTDNCQDGVSWVQIGDGALTEVHDMLNRMNELTIKALNGTNSESDRAAMEAEFDQLQTEIDRITATTKFNTKNIFYKHEPTYSQFTGDVTWSNLPKHVITDGFNELTFTFTPKYSDKEQTATITVPAGSYTTQELCDEIDDALVEAGLKNQGLNFEYSAQDTCNVNLEGSTKLSSVSGSLSYLLYDTFKGGSFGALIGTTEFVNAGSKLQIESGKNNHLSFDIQSMDGSITNKSISLASGYYTKDDLIDAINNQLSGTTVKAVPYGSGIKLASDDSIITGFKGNMFQIDSGSRIYHSIFYDNVKYGNVVMTKSYVQGGLVLNTDSRDTEHQKFNINSTNNTLKFTPNGTGVETTITIPDGQYTADEMVSKLKSLFTQDGLDLDAQKITGTLNSYTHEGIKILSNEIGNNSDVGLDTSSSAYNTLFVSQNYNTFSTVSPSRPSSIYTNTLATVTGLKNLSDSITINTGTNDSFNLTYVRNGVTNTKAITIDAGTYSIDTLIDNINNKLKDSSIMGSDKDIITAKKSNSNYIQLTSTLGDGITSISVSANGTNTGYNELFSGSTILNVNNKNSLTLDKVNSEPMSIDSSNNKLTIRTASNSGGSTASKTYTVTLPTGDNIKYEDVINAINTQINPSSETTSNSTYLVSRVSGNPTTNDCNINVSGVFTEIQGHVGPIANTGATATIPTSLLSSTTIDSSNNKFTFTLNNVSKTATIANGDYTPTGLVSALQTAINTVCGVDGNTYGGLKVSLSSGNKLTFTAGIKDPASGDNRPGDSTKLSINNSLGTFVKSINTPPVSATATTNRPIQNSITIDDTANKFSFYLNGTSKTVTLTNGIYDKNSFVNMMNDSLKAQGIAASVKLNGSNALIFTSTPSRTSSYFSSNDFSGNAVGAIFGKTTTDYPDIDASFSGGKLVLTSSIADRYIFVDTDKGSIFQSLKTTGKAPSTTTPTTQKSYIRGNALGSTTTINGLNNKLSFTYYENGTARPVNITMDNGTYTTDELVTKLQEKLNAVAGLDNPINNNGKLTVTNNSNTIQITSTYPGYNYYLSNFSGGFYDRVLGKATPVNRTAGVTTAPGTQSDNGCYTVGRKDIRNKTTEIKTGINDTLSVDLSFGGNSYTFDMLLKGGIYRGTDLVKEIQTKLNDSLVANGLPENFIIAQIGGVNSGVANSNDSDALVFKLNESINLPTDGEYIIDGVGGSAAFSVFYQTDGEIKVSYTKGARDISGGVEIKDGFNELSFKVDDKKYTIDIPSGKYNGTEIVDTINSLITAEGAEVFTELEDGKLKFNMTKFGSFDIGNVSGSAAALLYHNKVSENKPEEHIRIQVSNDALDFINIDRPLFSTPALDINTIAISDIKYATKALDHISAAIESVSSIRSYFGTMQNRMEHTIRNNDNKEENTSAAESVIRDTDMAKAMFEFSKQNILSQAIISMMTQANQSNQFVLSLL